MLAYKYKFTNTFNNRTFTIGEDLSGNDATVVGQGLILQTYPGFSLDIRNEEIDKSGQHGIWDSFSFYGKRNLSFQGIIKAPSHADLVTYERLIQQVLSLPAQPVDLVNDGYITIEWTDDNGDSWTVQAKITQDPQFSRNLRETLVASFILNLKVTDSFILSKDQNQLTGIMGWRQGQSIIPGFLPNDINIVYNNFLSLYQKGNTDAPAIYRLYGQSYNPKITRLDEVPTEETILADFISGEGWVGGSSDLVHFITSGESRKLHSVNGVQDKMNLVKNFDLDYDQAFSIPTILSSTDSTNGWSAVGDAENLVSDVVVKKEGTASIAFDIKVADSPNNYAGIINTSLNPVDVTSYKNVILDDYVYIPDVTHVTGIYLDLSSDAGLDGLKQTVSTDYLGNPFANGWNRVRFTLDEMTPYGTGLDRSNIDSVEARIVYDGGQSDMLGCRMDSFILYGDLKREFITFYFYIDDASQIEIGDYLVGQNYIKFIQNVGTDEFVTELQTGNNTIRNGWNYFTILKDQFTVIGNPLWTNITEIELSIKSIAGGNLNISFDDLRVKNITYNETFLQLFLTLNDGEYVDFNVQQGTITKNDGSTVAGNLTLDSTWFYLVPGKNTLIYESTDLDTLTQVLLDGLDSVGGWIASGNGFNVVANNVNFIQGTGSVSVDLNTLLSGVHSVGISNNLQTFNLSTYDNLYFQLGVYIPDVTNITGVYLDLASDAGDLNGVSKIVSQGIGGGALVSGWNIVQFTLSEMTVHGSGLDTSNIQFIDMRLTYNGGQTILMPGILFDALYAYGDTPSNTNNPLVSWEFPTQRVDIFWKDALL